MKVKSMKLAKIEHTSRPWRVHEITPEFKLEDVWALPTPGGPDDFHRLIEEAVTIDPAESTSRTVRTLFELRWKIGGLFGWDDDDAGLGARVPTLRDRLPADLRLEPGPNFEGLRSAPPTWRQSRPFASCSTRCFCVRSNASGRRGSAGARRRSWRKS